MAKDEVRAELLCKLNQVNIPNNWKIVLELQEGQREVQINFYKKNGFSLNIKNKTYYILHYWHCVRQICGYDYDDLLYKVNKYPELLETEVILNGNMGNE